MNLIASFGLICSLLFFTRQCGKEELAADKPECILGKIEEISQQEVWNPPAKVYQYTFRDQTVYFIPQHCCDIPSQLLDANCNIICAPDGGFSGKGDGTCSDFFEQRTDGKLIWEDPRKN